jgi:hypothetical protein
LTGLSQVVDSSRTPCFLGPEQTGETDTVAPDNPPPPPAGATRVDEWGKSWRGHICRTVFVPIGVAIAGTERADGHARRAMHVKDPDAPLTQGQARELAADELAARK